MKVYLATGNQGKVSELIPLVQKYFPQFSQVLARAPKVAEETESTFAGNARIKAEALASELVQENEALPFAVLADDSGLEVCSLGNRPGVNSARYAGDHANSEANVKKLLSEMHSLEQRECRYVCCLYVHIEQVDGAKLACHTEGYCEGRIMQEAKGSGGFGYDPVFWSPSLNKRMSEASLNEKNAFSHRLDAFEKLKKILPTCS